MSWAIERGPGQLAALPLPLPTFHPLSLQSELGDALNALTPKKKRRPASRQRQRSAAA